MQTGDQVLTDHIVARALQTRSTPLRRRSRDFIFDTVIAAIGKLFTGKYHHDANEGRGCPARGR